jgi:hypothetical protein
MKKQYVEFETALKNKFLELRPSLPTPESFEQLVTDPIFCTLLIIDRTIARPEIFEAGYLIWEELDRDLDKFVGSFKVELVDGEFRVLPYFDTEDNTAVDDTPK